MKTSNITIKGKNRWNDSHGSPYKRAPSNFFSDKTYWIVVLRMSVLVYTLDAGSPKRRICVKVESFCFRNLWLIIFMLVRKVFLTSANKGQCRR